MPTTAAPHSNFQYSVGEGTGRLAGTESILCMSQGTVRYDPLAGAGQ